ncbi:MAG: FGGY family carbohydrate kinase [Oceanipulchritudo sp.]
MSKTTVAAIDFGATSGRVIVGQITPEGLELTETHRFQNAFSTIGSRNYWDVGRLLKEALEGLEESLRLFPELRSCGIDTWGVDHAITSREGRLAFPVHAYRDERTTPVMKRIQARGENRRLFDLTGLPTVKYNTGIQLAETLEAFPGITGVGEKLFMLPEYFTYLLTGKEGCDYSFASTTQLMDVHSKSWSQEAMAYFGIPPEWLGQPEPAGVIIGNVTTRKPLESLEVARVPGHDTSCAFEAIPRDGNSLIVSSGTWMLVGGITEKPCLGDEAFALGVSNERTGNGGYRPNKILLGLWMLERLIPSFEQRPQTDAEWSSLISAATERPLPPVLIDTSDEALFNPRDMRAAIDRQLKASNGTIPDDLPGYLALICASLGASVRDTALRLESILNKTFENIVIVGGGAKNSLLCQMIADFSGKQVTSYNLEATSVGNMAYQLLALGEIGSLEAFHDLIRPSLSGKVYQPR